MCDIFPLFMHQRIVNLWQIVFKTISNRARGSKSLKIENKSQHWKKGFFSSFWWASECWNTKNARLQLRQLEANVINAEFPREGNSVFIVSIFPFHSSCLSEEKSFLREKIMILRKSSTEYLCYLRPLCSCLISNLNQQY